RRPMHMPLDLRPAAQRMATLVARVPDDALDRPTPCPDYRLGDLLDHVGGLAIAFRCAALKSFEELGDAGSPGDASRLGSDWRTRIPDALEALGEAWQDDSAWTGMTKAGGLELPGEVAGLVALDELVIHAWDVARASGQPYEVDEPSLH